MKPVLHRRNRVQPMCVLTALVSLAIHTTSAYGADSPGPPDPLGARPTVLSDANGAIEECLLHYADSYVESLDSLYADLFASLPVGVHVQVICASDALVEQFENDWGRIERERGRPLTVLNVDRPITVWARDRRIARQDDVTGEAAPAIVPRDCRDWDEEYRNELDIGPLTELAGYACATVDTPLELEGGNVVANGRHVFVGINVLSENERNGIDHAATRRELLKILGRPFLLVGNGDQNPPWCHVDMYLTPVGDKTVLVASPAITAMLLDEERYADLPLDELYTFDECIHSLERQSAGFDQVAAQLKRYGYRVLRLPAVAGPGGEWMITYNNVLMDECDGQRTVYMPVYQLPILDDAAESLYRGLGFDVHRVDVSEIFKDGGALRCVVNVTRRSISSSVDKDAAAVSAVSSLAVAGTTAAPPVSPTDPAYAVAGSFLGVVPLFGLWLPLLIFLAWIWRWRPRVSAHRVAVGVSQRPGGDDMKLVRYEVPGHKPRRRPRGADATRCG